MRKYLIIFLLFLSTPLAARASLETNLRPKPAEGYEVKDERIYYRKGNAGMIVEAATDDSIARYYGERGAEIGNPFRAIGGEVQEATIFILTLLNRTNSSLTFTPRYTTLRIKTEAYFPLDFTVLLGFLEGMEPQMSKVLQKSIFHSPEIVQPKQVVTKLLIFPALPKKYEGLRLEFDYLYFKSAEIRTVFHFTRKKQQESK